MTRYYKPSPAVAQVGGLCAGKRCAGLGLAVLRHGRPDVTMPAQVQVHPAYHVHFMDLPCHIPEQNQLTMYGRQHPKQCKGESARTTEFVLKGTGAGALALCALWLLSLLLSSRTMLATLHKD